MFGFEIQACAITQGPTRSSIAKSMVPPAPMCVPNGTQHVISPIEAQGEGRWVHERSRAIQSTHSLYAIRLFASALHLFTGLISCRVPSNPCWTKPLRMYTTLPSYRPCIIHKIDTVSNPLFFMSMYNMSSFRTPRTSTIPLSNMHTAPAADDAFIPALSNPADIDGHDQRSDEGRSTRRAHKGLS